MIYSPANFASVANDMAFLIMCVMLSTAPLFSGTIMSLKRKKCPPALLRALGLLKLLASLCTANTILLTK